MLPIFAFHDVVTGFQLGLEAQKDVHPATATHVSVQLHLISHKPENVGGLALEFLRLVNSMRRALNFQGRQMDIPCGALVGPNEIQSLIFQNPRNFPEPRTEHRIVRVLRSPDDFVQGDLRVIGDFDLGGEVVFLPFFQPGLLELPSVQRGQGCGKVNLEVPAATKVLHQFPTGQRIVHIPGAAQVLSSVTEYHEHHFGKLNAADPADVRIAGARVDQNKIGMILEEFFPNEFEQQKPRRFSLTEEFAPFYCIVFPGVLPGIVQPARRQDTKPGVVLMGNEIRGESVGIQGTVLSLREIRGNIHKAAVDFSKALEVGDVLHSGSFDIHVPDDDGFALLSKPHSRIYQRQGPTDAAFERVKRREKGTVSHCMQPLVAPLIQTLPWA